MQVHQLDVTEDDLGLLYKAVILCRDTAFVNTGHKRSPAVKRWEALRDKITDLQGRIGE